VLLVRLATWNVNSLKARLPRVEEWLATVEPDVVCLQETKMADTAFPAMALRSLGYEAAHHGEGRWNGVAVLSRVGVEDVTTGFGADPELDREARLVSARCDGVRVASAYVPNGRSLDDDHYTYKLAWLDQLVRWAGDRIGEPLIIAGDFNIAPDDRDVWDPAEFEGATHVSEAERDRFDALVALGLVDVFRRHYDAPGLYSWWDYRAGNFHKRKGMRIDHVLARADVADRTTAVLIDRNARKGKSPSDHAPVVVDIAESAPG
jgi:exodeoxyribonuclease-3